MQKGVRDSPFDIRPGDWDTSPYVPDYKRYMLRRSFGSEIVKPVFSAEEIIEGIEKFLWKEEEK